MLTQGKVAVVDDADYESVSQFQWHAIKKVNCWYAGGPRNVDKHRRICLHHFIMCPPDGCRIDHIDGNGLNNQRHNLRVCTHQQNLFAFRHKRKGTSSKYRGVAWNRQISRWVAYIQPDGKKHHLGYFDSEEDAARVYDAAARKFFGDFVSLNFK